MIVEITLSLACLLAQAPVDRAMSAPPPGLTVASHAALAEQRVELEPRIDRPDTPRSARVLPRWAQVLLITGGTGMVASGVALVSRSDVRYVSAGSGLLALGGSTLTSGAVTMAVDHRRLVRRRAEPVGFGVLGGVGVSAAVGGLGVLFGAAMMFTRADLREPSGLYGVDPRRPSGIAMGLGALGVTAGVTMLALDLTLVDHGGTRRHPGPRVQVSPTPSGVQIRGRF